jgi:hypothetical protein
VEQASDLRLLSLSFPIAPREILQNLSFKALYLGREFEAITFSSRHHRVINRPELVSSKVAVEVCSAAGYFEHEFTGRFATQATDKST